MNSVRLCRSALRHFHQWRPIARTLSTSSRHYDWEEPRLKSVYWRLFVFDMRLRDSRGSSPIVHLNYFQPFSALVFSSLAQTFFSCLTPFFKKGKKTKHFFGILPCKCCSLYQRIAWPHSFHSNLLPVTGGAFRPHWSVETPPRGFFFFVIVVFCFVWLLFIYRMQKVDSSIVMSLRSAGAFGLRL